MICKAQNEDFDTIIELLKQVNQIHYDKRPDIFKNHTKYNKEDLTAFLNDKNQMIFVYKENNTVLGYAFCKIKETKDNNLLQDRKVLYIDDLCVDENNRRKHIGTKLFEYLTTYSKENHFESIELNVWNLNEPALHFYQKCGLVPLKTILQKKLD